MRLRGPYLCFAVGLLSISCGDERSTETARIRAHLETVERELRSASPPGLTASQLTGRARAIELLHHYIAEEKYPRNLHSSSLTPIFVDDVGSRCAVAALLEATGHRELVGRISRTRNFAYVPELKDEPELVAWLAENGLTLAEAARIQPSYSNQTTRRWRQTASLFGAAHAGRSGDNTGELLFAPGFRAGATQITETGSACDRCVYTTLSVLAELTHSFAISGRQSTRLGLLLTYDLNEQARDHSWYLLGGPFAARSTQRTLGFGGQAGGGFTFRGDVVGTFFEVVAAVLQDSGGVAARGGVNVGVAF